MIELQEKQMLNFMDQHTRHVVLYHANCDDGFCSALLLWQAMSHDSEIANISLVPMNYGDDIPQIYDNDIVYFVDFSFKRDKMFEVCRLAKFVYVLDHHKTAKEEMSMLFLADVDNLAIYFDMNRSGAKLVFDFLYQLRETGDNLPLEIPYAPEKQVPILVRYIQDRDLWLRELAYTEEMTAYIRSLDFCLHEWGNLLLGLQESQYFNKCIEAGSSVLRFTKKQIDKSVFAASFKVLETPRGKVLSVPVVNCPSNISEVLEKLCTIHEQAKCAVAWFQRPDNKFQYSLRSIGDFDVSELAKEFGGGGHKNAAGFESDTLVV